MSDTVIKTNDIHTYCWFQLRQNEGFVTIVQSWG